ncbi:hypothetical protein [Methyloferula stellata]
MMMTVVAAAPGVAVVMIVIVVAAAPGVAVVMIVIVGMRLKIHRRT